MSNDPQRDDWNRRAMREHNLDVLICRLPENVLVLTGFWPPSGFAFAAISGEGPSCLIVMETEAAEVPVGAADELTVIPYGMLKAPEPYGAVQRELGRFLRSTGLERARIGREESFETVAPGFGAGEVLVPAAVTLDMIVGAAPDATFVDAMPALYQARAIKTPMDLEKLRRANTIAAFGLEAFRTLFEPGRTEAEVAAGVEAAIMSRGIGYEGTRHARSWAQLMSGPGSVSAWSAHPATSARVIQEGDLGVLELGTVADGYWSDLTRTLVAGSPNTRQQEMYEAILAAHRAITAGVRPSMTGTEVDALGRDEIARRGLADLFVHATGHGLGFRYHEPPPLLAPGNDKTVVPGMVSSVEPGLYQQGLGGMRLEENVVFTDTGIELLSHFDTSLAV